MYSAALLFIWASVAGHANAWTVTLAAAVTVLAVARVRAEERLLRTKYADYDACARATTALVPFLV